jgi:ATP-dependent Clp protease ATP-binding subunit ClpA
MARNGIGFGDISKADAGEEAVKNLFTPEFRNRLDAIVPFAYLGKEVVSRVVDKFILQLELQLADQNVHIQFDAEARDWLGDRGYDRLYGARPMARLIQDKVKQPLAEELLFGKLAHGGLVTVKEGEDGTKGLTFVLTPAPPRLDRKAGKPKGKGAGNGKGRAQPETSGDND